MSGVSAVGPSLSHTSWSHLSTVVFLLVQEACRRAAHSARPCGQGGEEVLLQLPETQAQCEAGVLTPPEVDWVASCTELSAQLYCMSQSDPGGE